MPVRPRSLTNGDTARRRSRARRAETWLWTGPVGHLLGGGLDFLQALARYLHARRRRRRESS